MTKGWTALTETISGYQLVWAIEENGHLYPQIEPNREDIMKEIAEDMIITLQQYIDGEREEDETDWCATCIPAEIEIDDDENITVWYDNGDEAIVTTLTEWRNNR